jgi:hypothetical protein
MDEVNKLRVAWLARQGGDTERVVYVFIRGQIKQISLRYYAFLFADKQERPPFFSSLDMLYVAYPSERQTPVAYMVSDFSENHNGVLVIDDNGFKRYIKDLGNNRFAITCFSLL